MKKKLFIPWWALVLAGWLIYGGQFVLTSVLSFETAPPVLTRVLFDVGRAMAVILMATGSYVLLRQAMGVVASFVLGIFAGLAQMWALNIAIALFAFSGT